MDGHGRTLTELQERIAQQAVEKAARQLADAGAVVVSIVTRWPDGKDITKIVVNESKRDSAPQMTEIDREVLK